MKGNVGIIEQACPKSKDQKILLRQIIEGG